MGWEPPILRHNCDILRLWNRFIKMPEQRVTKKIFNWDITNMHPWAEEVRAVMSMVDMSFIFHNKLQCNIHEIKNELFIRYKKNGVLKYGVNLNYEHFVKSRLSISQKTMFAITSPKPTGLSVRNYVQVPSHLPWKQDGLMEPQRNKGSVCSVS